MASSLPDSLLGILQLSLLSVLALFLPLVLELGLLFLVGRAFARLAFRVSFGLASLLGLIGVPIHEFSHAIAFLATLCGVEAITPLIDRRSLTATTYPKRPNPLGMFVAGLAPLIGGTLVLWLAARYIIPGFNIPGVTPPRLNLANVTSWGSVFKGSLAYVGQLLRTTWRYLPDLQWDNWRTWVGLYVALSVAVGIAPSNQDLKVFVVALPIVLLLAVGVFGVLYATGDAGKQFVALQRGLAPHLLKFSTAVTYAFILTLLGVLVLLPLALLRQLRGR